MSDKKIIGILVTCVGCAPASATARALKKTLDTHLYEIVGIDMKTLCVGNFICDAYINIQNKVGEQEYWTQIENIIEKYNVKFIFVSLSTEAYEWTLRKDMYKDRYACTVLLNNTEFCEIANNKLKTFDFSVKNSIQVPPICLLEERPIVIKEIDGAGSQGLQILRHSTDIPDNFDKTKFMIQKYIDGDEYTVDVISDPIGNVINIIPKKRCFVKNGQSFTSTVCYDLDIINFVNNVCIKTKNKCAINVQVIKEYITNDIYLIEINARLPTSISLTIEAGVNIPKMLIECDYVPKNVKYGLTMVRDYCEYYTQLI